MRRLTPTILIVCCLTLTGCGGGGSTVNGTATKGGKPFAATEGDQVSIVLTQDGGSASGTGAVGADGTFKISGSDGKGLPAGKYKVGLTIYHATPVDPKKPTPPPRIIDTKETWEVGGANTTFALDLDKYK